MLEATIEVNRRLEARVPAATSPAEIDEVLEAAREIDALAVNELALGEPRQERATA
jgi:hypothetical protein